MFVSRSHKDSSVVKRGVDRITVSTTDRSGALDFFQDFKAN